MEFSFLIIHFRFIETISSTLSSTKNGDESTKPYRTLKYIFEYIYCSYRIRQEEKIPSKFALMYQ